MRIPFISAFFPRTAAAVMAQFTGMVTELEAIAVAHDAKAIKASDKAEAAYDKGMNTAEDLRRTAEQAMIQALALADEVEEAAAVKASELGVKWEASVRAADEARASANMLRRTFGIED